MSRHVPSQQMWGDLCSELSYPAEVRGTGLELLQRLQSSQDKLGEGPQVRVA